MILANHRETFCDRAWLARSCGSFEEFCEGARRHAADDGSLKIADESAAFAATRPKEIITSACDFCL